MKVYVITPNVNCKEVEERFDKPITTLDESECAVLEQESRERGRYDVVLYDRIDEFECAFNNGEISDDGFIRFFND